MQRAGRGDERRRREHPRGGEGQAEQRGEREDKRADEADRDAGDRRRPGDAVNVEGRAWPGSPTEASEKAQGVGDVARGGGAAGEPSP